MRNGVERVPAPSTDNVTVRCGRVQHSVGFRSDHVKETLGGVQKTVTESIPPHSIWTPSLLYANG